MLSPARRRSDSARWLADLLRAQIEQAPAEPGATSLPSEYDLSRKFGVSRNTVREALHLLRNERLLRRVPGAGTFVATRRAEQRLDRLRGLAETFRGSPDRVVNRVLAADVRPAPDYVASQLELEAGAPVMFVERLRSLDDDPLSLDGTYLPVDVAAPLLGPVPAQDTLGGCDVFALLERTLGVRLGTATLCIEAVAADPGAARLLAVEPAAPLLLVTRLARLADGRPVDFEFVRYRGDRLSLTALLSRTVDGIDL